MSKIDETIRKIRKATEKAGLAMNNLGTTKTAAFIRSSCPGIPTAQFVAVLAISGEMCQLITQILARLSLVLAAQQKSTRALGQDYLK